MSTTAESDWRTTSAPAFARTVATVLRTPYPYAAQHVSSSADDVDVTPERLHPAFHGSFDWHSSAHMQWSAVRLLEVAGDVLDGQDAGRLVDVLDERLTMRACHVEASYLREHPRFERPYGWAWVALLAAETYHSSHPHAGRWAEATRPLFDVVADLVLAWLPALAYPVRQGEHANLAFALSLVHEAATRLDAPQVLRIVREHARRFFLADRDYPSRWEPGGSDFLSPALCEADLMGRVLGRGTPEYDDWLSAFLPVLGAAGTDDPLLRSPEVRDPTDGKAVHLNGLALSRAWQLRRLASSLPDGNGERVRAAATTMVDGALSHVSGGDFMSTHWLVSFALLAECGD